MGFLRLLILDVGAADPKDGFEGELFVVLFRVVVTLPHAGELLPLVLAHIEVRELIHDVVLHVVGLCFVHGGLELLRGVLVIGLLVVNIAKEGMYLAHVLIVRMLLGDLGEHFLRLVLLTFLEGDESEAVFGIAEVVSFGILLDVGLQSFDHVLVIVLVEVTQGDAVEALVLVNAVLVRCHEGIEGGAALLKALQFKQHDAAEVTETLLVRLGEAGGLVEGAFGFFELAVLIGEHAVHLGNLAQLAAVREVLDEFLAKRPRLWNALQGGIHHNEAVHAAITLGEVFELIDDGGEG